MLILVLGVVLGRIEKALVVVVVKARAAVVAAITNERRMDCLGVVDDGVQRGC